MITSIMALTAGKLSVKITDMQTPIIIPFAPNNFGKTCLLHRIVHYLRSNGFLLKLDMLFLPPHVIQYSNVCVEYMDALCTNCSPCATAIPVLGKIMYNSKTIVQFIDFPGNFLYDTFNPRKPSALKEILALSNKKIWLFLLDLDGLNGQFERTNYSERIREVAAHISSNDKIIIVINKIDMYSTSLKSKEDLIQAIYHQYPTVLNCFKNQNPITKLWRPFNCDIIPFTAGLFCRTYDNKEVFQPGLDTYPKQLWKSVSKSFR